MTIEELRKKIREIRDQLKALYEKNDRTADDDKKMIDLVAEFDLLTPQLEALSATEKTLLVMEQLSQSRGTVAGGVGQERLGQSEERTLSIGERFASSDELANHRKAGYGGKSEGFVVQSFRENLALVKIGTTGTVETHYVPGMQRGRDYALTLRQVIIGGTTTSNLISFLRELVFTNNAAEVGEATASDGASGLKPESAYTWERDDAPVKTIAHHIPITKNTLDDAPQVATIVNDRLLVGVDRRINSQIANGDGTGENLLGIIETPGVTVFDDTYFGSNPVVNVGTPVENFDRIAATIAGVENVGDGEATFVAVNPLDYQKLITIANADYEYLAGSPFGSISVRTVWGRPLAVDRAIPEGTFITGDGTAAAYWEREDATLFVDTINDQFIRNMKTLLAEARGALTVYRPAAMVIGEFTWDA